MMVKRQRKFSEQIEAGIAEGSFDPNLDANDAAAILLTLIQGLAMRWSLNARGFDLVEEGTRLFELQLKGFSSGPNQGSNRASGLIEK